MTTLHPAVCPPVHDHQQNADRGVAQCEVCRSITKGVFDPHRQQSNRKHLPQHQQTVGQVVDDEAIHVESRACP